MPWVKIASISEVSPGSAKTVNASGKDLALYNIGGTFYCTDNTCLHRGGPLGEGMLDAENVTCPWHGWMYNVKSGQCETNPAMKLKTYPVQVQGTDVMVEM
ncbi:MAG: non-heme iron oxygenase ferredoxin subunit [Candidatus Diapherotrites archaeon]|nr:non-heme iron oxygenase ferredoxin subunit [Candidatus Diapherotrites archaeon]